MKASEVKKILGISSGTLKKLRDNNNIKFIKYSNHKIDYDKKSVYEYKYNTKRKNILYYCDNNIINIFDNLKKIKNECNNFDVEIDEFYYDLIKNNCHDLTLKNNPNLFKIIKESLDGKIDKIIILNEENFILNKNFFNIINLFFKKNGIDLIIIDNLK